MRSIVEVHRCAKCAQLSEQVWRSMAPDAEQFLRPGDDEEAWNWLLPGARFQAGRDRFGYALPASVPPFPDSHTHEWRKIPAGIHIGAAAEAIRGTLPEHGQGVWHIGFSEWHRQFFIFLLGAQNDILCRTWDRPGNGRDMRDQVCRYVRHPPTGEASNYGY